jgi:CubicO group peptidase (beta-lactamase class C family)
VEALRQIDGWSAEHAAAVVVSADGSSAYGDMEHSFPWASVTKLATALVTLVAVEEGSVDLDAPAGPPGSAVRHLLAHASGLPPESGEPIAQPGARRVYSNYGFEVLASVVEAAVEMPFAAYFEEALAPADVRPVLHGSPAHGGHGHIGDLARLGLELLRPGLVAPETLVEATTAQFPGLVGVLPGFGRMDSNDWGLGFELRDGKSPHWTGTRNSPRTFGHFGRSGAFLWVDPEAQLALACLTDREFGDWAKEAWPRLADAVLAEASSLS